VVGRIVRPHGLRGEVVVEVLTDVPERFSPGARLGLGDPEGEPRDVVVLSARPDRRRLLVRFRALSDRAAAEAVRGELLSIPTEDASPPPEGSFYPHQIEGLLVTDEGGRPLGTLARALAGGANDVWVVDTGSAEVMVPAVADIVRSVDLDAGVIVVRPLPGMFA
jgi:16S rRNA processing protein RimM